MFPEQFDRRRQLVGRAQSAVPRFDSFHRRSDNSRIWVKLENMGCFQYYIAEMKRNQDSSGRAHADEAFDNAVRGPNGCYSVEGDLSRREYGFVEVQELVNDRLRARAADLLSRRVSADVVQRSTGLPMSVLDVVGHGPTTPSTQVVENGRPVTSRD